MSALETTAALTNNLVALLKVAPSPNQFELASVFAATQAARQPRAAALVAVSRLTQHRFAMATPWLRFMNRWVYPAMGSRAALRLLSGAYPGAASLVEAPVWRARGGGEKVKGLPAWLPRATAGHALPYDDELVAPPRPRSALATGVVVVLLLVLSMVGVYFRHTQPSSASGIARFLSVDLPLSIMMMVEGNRKRNTWSLIWRYAVPPPPNPSQHGFPR